ncbi:MAG TPA: 30S ribosomal protein S6 [bacterium]
MKTGDYDGLFIIRMRGTEQETQSVAREVEELITRLGGQIAVARSMGRRRLAFRIAKQTEGVYHHVRFTAPREQIREFDRLLRLNENIIRFMTISGDEIPAPQEPVAAA